MGNFNQQLFSKGCCCKLISKLCHTSVCPSNGWRENLIVHHWTFVVLRVSSASISSLYALQLYHGLVSFPGPTLSRGKGSGDYWAISWLCWVNSLDFGQSNEIVPRHPSVRMNQWNRPYVMQASNQRSFKINTAESAQPRNHSIVTRPFSSWEGGVWARD